MGYYLTKSDMRISVKEPRSPTQFLKLANFSGSGQVIETAELTTVAECRFLSGDHKLDDTGPLLLLMASRYYKGWRKTVDEGGVRPLLVA